MSAGFPEPLGVVLEEDGANVAVFSAHADRVFFCLFDEADREIARVPLDGRTGDVFHARIAGVAAGARYGLRVEGVWDPAGGHRFNGNKLLLDPFATAIDRPFRLDPTLFDRDVPNPADTAPVMPKGVIGPALTQPARQPRFDWRGQVIYELHVRGFTRLHPDVPEAIRGTYAALAHPAVLEHLAALGVTAVELMPSAAWIDERHLPPLGLCNYWGYNPVALLAPDPRLAPGGWAEVRGAVAALQSAGIAVLLDVVLNHTGEGDHLGPTLSLRGLDNASYYRLRREDRALYRDDTGCGHALALDRAPVVRLAMEALRCWAARAGIDGFRFDLAATLARREDGFDPAPPLLTAIDQDPLLRGLARIAEPWDVGEGGYRLGGFPADWGEWNDRFRDTARRFWRGDPGMVGALATRLAGSADVFAARHRPLSRSVNFVTAHDGFTLADLVSHECKHNEANGEQNRDGTDQSFSWNSGVEGATEDPAIGARRVADARALLTTLLLARGTPMLSMGDECGRSQLGNNNAYAQDNPVSWLDWTRADRALVTFCARLVALRRASPALIADAPLTGAADGSGIPDVAWFTQDGRPMAPADWEEPGNRLLVVALHAAGSRIVAALNAGGREMEITLPVRRAGARWRIALDSAEPERAGEAGRHVTVRARSVLVLLEERG